MALTKADTLRKALKTLNPNPLLTKEELDAFYSDSVNTLRGDDKIKHIELGLDGADRRNPFQVFLVGHSGTGKSTEVTRLVELTKDRYRFIRFDANRDVNPILFQPFDILLLMMILLIEETEKVVDVKAEGSGRKPDDRLLKNIYDWYQITTVIVDKNLSGEVKAEAGGSVGTPDAAWWPKIVKLFVGVRGEIKYATNRDERSILYRLSRTNELIELINELIEQCNDILLLETGCRWVFIGEGFDKPGIPRPRVEELFISHGNMIRDLNTDLIFNIPLTLFYSEKGRSLPRLGGGSITIPDTPIYHYPSKIENRKEHTLNKEGIAVLQSILEQRLSAELFEKGQMERLIVASGGNISNLLLLTQAAARFAILRSESNQKISQTDVNRVIADAKREFEGALGSDPSDEVPITYSEKAKKLLAIYHGEAEVEIRDSELNSLLRAGAVQEFNGDWWFGVHPIVVDILWEQGRLIRDDKGILPGGTI